VFHPARANPLAVNPDGPFHAFGAKPEHGEVAFFAVYLNVAQAPMIAIRIPAPGRDRPARAPREAFRSAEAPAAVYA
jgi:hypothetical protein